MERTFEDVRLLILDDEADICQVIEAAARRAGATARSTIHAGEFAVLCESWRPTHLVLDLAMPGIDGLSMLRILAQADRQTDIIIISGKGTRILEAAKRFAIESGLSITGVLAKPFTPKRLRELLAAGGSLRGKESPQTNDPTEGTEPITPDHLSDAIARDELRVFYQPKISCADGQPIGFEALVRWQHPLRGTLAPCLFVPVAEESGLIDLLTRNVATQAIAWSSQVLNGTQQVSINISPLTLQSAFFASWMKEECERFSVEPRNVVLELTETSGIRNPLDALEYLTRLRLQGFDLGIDDFGVGYSSLVQLARLPFSEMKIDRQFMMTVEASSESRAIALSNVRLAHRLGMKVTAEGVETPWSMNFARSAGCDTAQGFLIARPMPAEAAKEWLQTRPASSVLSALAGSK